MTTLQIVSKARPGHRAVSIRMDCVLVIWLKGGIPCKKENILSMSPFHQNATQHILIKNVSFQPKYVLSRKIVDGWEVYNGNNLVTHQSFCSVT